MSLDREKFRKVLALVESENESEALAALQSARRLLAREGLRFSDLVDLTAPGFWGRRRAGMGAGAGAAAAGGGFASAWNSMTNRPGFRTASPDAALLEEMAELRTSHADLREQLRDRTRELSEATQALEAEQLKAARAAAERSREWRDRETQWERRLADLRREKAPSGGPRGRALANRVAGQPASASARREAGLQMLCDPQSAKLSNREIARRLGVSPQSVSNWRRLLARQDSKGAEKAAEKSASKPAGASETARTEDAPAKESPKDLLKGPARLLTIPLLRRRQGG